MTFELRTLKYTLTNLYTTKQAHKQNSIFKTLDTFTAFSLALRAFSVAQCALLETTALSECQCEREERQCFKYCLAKTQSNTTPGSIQMQYISYTTLVKL